MCSVTCRPYMFSITHVFSYMYMFSITHVFSYMYMFSITHVFICMYMFSITHMCSVTCTRVFYTLTLNHVLLYQLLFR